MIVASKSKSWNVLGTFLSHLKWYHYVLQLVLEILCLISGFSGFMMSRMYGGNALTKKHGVEVQRNPQIQPTKMIPVAFTKVKT